MACSENGQLKTDLTEFPELHGDTHAKAHLQEVWIS